MILFGTYSQFRVARTLANLLLIALVCYLSVVLARATWAILWQEQPIAVPSTIDSGGLQSYSGSSRSIAGFDFFGRSMVTSPVAQSVKRAAPETGLRLRLEGVLVGARPEDSGAIVAQGNGDTAYYRVGERLPGNAELAEVEPDRILIRRSGQYESLSFDETIDAGMVAQVQEAPSEASPDDFLASARRQLDTMGAAALARYGLNPVDDSGLSGYVYDGSNAMLNAVNLQAGDVITAINGQRLGNIEQDRSLLENWRSQPRLDIELERNGSLLSVSYAIPEQWR